MNKLLFIIFLFVFCNNICFAEQIQDEIVDEFLEFKQLEKPIINTNYDYDSTECIPIKLNISEKLSTKKSNITDGQQVTLYAKKDVYYENKILIKKGTKFNAIVETYMTKGMNGIPAIIIIDKFTTDNLNQNKIKGTYIKRGRNRSLLVFPLKWALTPIPGVGSLTNFIPGGNAAVSTNDNIVIYYYPDWDTI